MVTSATALAADAVENMAARGNPHAQRLLLLAYRQAVAEFLMELEPPGDREVSLTSPSLRVILDCISGAEAVLPEFDGYFDEWDGPLTPEQRRKLLAWLLEEVR